MNLADLSPEASKSLTFAALWTAGILLFAWSVRLAMKD